MPGGAYCDGCQQAVTAEHLQRRIQRLALASRYRPLRIELLFLGDAPPPAPEDCFYAETEKNGGWKALFAALVESLDIQSRGVAHALQEFQKRHAFLAHIVECPIQELPRATEGELIERYGTAALSRIRHAYRPSWVLPVGGRLVQTFLPLLRQGELASRVLFLDGQPLPDPTSPDAREQFLAGVRSLLAHVHPMETR